MVSRRVLTWAHFWGRKDIALTRLHDPDAPDPPVGEFSTGELGAMLRESRQSLGRELEDVAAELRIRLVYLQAIEDGRLDDLPGIAYATGFLRAYGDLLGLDGEDLVRRFKAAGLAMTQATDLHLPSPVEEGRLPTGSVLLVAALLAVGAYGGWYYMSSQGRDPIDNVSALPDQLAELVGIEGGDKQAEDAPAAASTDVAAPADGEQTTAMAEPETATPTEGAGDAPVVASSDEPATSDATAVATSDVAAAEPEATTEPATQPDEPAPAAQQADEPPPPAPAAIARREAGVERTVAATPEPTPAPAISPPPPSESAPASTESLAVEAVASAPPEAPAAPSAPEPEQPPVTADRVPAPEPVAVAVLEPEVAPADPAPAATKIVAAATHRVVLRANTDTWVEVGAAEAAPVLSRLMRQGETFTVPAQPGLMMATGNAGGIEILVDGKAVPQLGPVGVIRRNVALDAESLLKGVAATP